MKRFESRKKCSCVCVYVPRKSNEVSRQIDKYFPLFPGKESGKEQGNQILEDLRDTAACLSALLAPSLPAHSSKQACRKREQNRETAIAALHHNPKSTKRGTTNLDGPVMEGISRAFVVNEGQSQEMEGGGYESRCPDDFKGEQEATADGYLEHDRQV